MSRSYKKVVKQGICNGSNTKYYRARRKWIRNKNNQILRNFITNYTVDDVNDLIVFVKLPKRNSWDEPTDGTYLIYKKDRDFYVNDPYFGNLHDGTSLNFWNRKLGKYLKNKHR